jgi:pimeloyl-ACP methyl ester carboxylesterase
MSREPLARRAFLGADLERGEGGLVVVEVTPGAAADLAGLAVGDVLLAVGDVPVRGVMDAYSRIGELPAGRGVRLAVRRGDEQLDLEAVLSEMPLETFSAGRVELDQVEWRGYRLRAVWTFPEGEGPFAAVWLLPGATWLAEEQPLRDWYPTRQLVGELSKAGFATLRVERSGLGDSEGPACTELDLESELSAFRAARSYFLTHPAVAATGRFLYGRSLGGMLSPLLAEEQPFTAVAVWGTSPGPWHRVMLDASRAQYLLAGQPRVVERVLARLEALQTLVYVEGLSPGEAYARRPELADVQPESFAGSYVYGRTYRYFHQLEHAPVAESWKRVSCPVLALRGTNDYLSSAVEHERIVQLAPHAVAHEVPGLDHHMHERASLEEALREPWGGTFSPTAAQALVDFFRKAQTFTDNRESGYKAPRAP